MLICEWLFFLILLGCLPVAAWSDLKRGIVSNRLLAYACAMGLIVDTIYYSGFAGECFLPFLANFGLTAFFSFYFYYQGFWGAGDSKLLILIMLCLPGRIFCKAGFWSFPGFILISVIFSISFLVIFVSSVLRFGNKQRKHEKKPHSFSGERMLEGIKKFVFLFCCVGSINAFLSLDFLASLRLTYPLILAIDFVVIMSLNRKSVAPAPIYLWASIILYSLLSFAAQRLFSCKSILFSTVFILFLLVVQRVSSDDNYQIIAAADAQQGMILDYSSAALLAQSRIPGLPTKTTADMRSRISQEEADAIHAWGKKHPGHDRLVIIRKIPFALFVAIGTFIFWGLEVFGF